MSIVRKTDITAAENRFKNEEFTPNTVICMRRVDFDLAEMKKLIAAIDAFNNTQNAGNRVISVRCRVIAELPAAGATPLLNMYMTSVHPTTNESKDFNLNVGSEVDVVVGRPCPPHCMTAPEANVIHKLTK